MLKQEREAIDALQEGMTKALLGSGGGFVVRHRENGTLRERELPGRVIMAMRPESREKLTNLTSDLLARIRVDPFWILYK